MAKVADLGWEQRYGANRPTRSVLAHRGLKSSGEHVKEHTHAQYDYKHLQSLRRACEGISWRQLHRLHPQKAQDQMKLVPSLRLHHHRHLSQYRSHLRAHLGPSQAPQQAAAALGRKERVVMGEWQEPVTMVEEEASNTEFKTQPPEKRRRTGHVLTSRAASKHSVSQRKLKPDAYCANFTCAGGTLHQQS